MEEMKKVLTREEAELTKENIWATEDLYVSDAAWEEDLKRTAYFMEEMKKYEGHLNEGGNQLLGLYQLLDDFSLWEDRLANYAMRKSDQDTKNAKYQDCVMRMMMNLNQTVATLSYFEPELMQISDERLEEFYAQTEGLELYRNAIKDVRRKKDHILTEAEEKILAAAADMSQTPENTFGMFNNADITFPSVKDSQGNERQVTHGTFIPLMESKDRVLRKAAFESVYHTYQSFKNTNASILSGQVQQLIFHAKTRKYNSTLEAALDQTNVAVSVYHNLIEAVHNNMDKMHKYVALRKKLMKVEELHFYDLYTPMVEEKEVSIPYDTAKKNVLEAVKPLGEAYNEILGKGFESRWVDVYENIGKRSGAYSAGAKEHPFVLMNYSGTLDSEFTLAHEMGHAMHSYLSNHTQPTVYSQYRIFVAEVASTCNEALLMQHLLKNTTDKMERVSLINHFLDQFKGTIYRQTMFAEFEMKINAMAERGESITADALCNLYEELQKQYFGDGIVIDDEIRYEWSRIPHFYYNFYVFQYATGFSAAIALSQKILAEGKPAVDQYLNFLSGGCSKDPVSLLKDAGVDMNTAKPVNDALLLFGQLIDEMEQLLAD